MKARIIFLLAGLLCGTALAQEGKSVSTGQPADKTDKVYSTNQVGTPAAKGGKVYSTTQAQRPIRRPRRSRNASSCASTTWTSRPCAARPMGCSRSRWAPT